MKKIYINLIILFQLFLVGSVAGQCAFRIQLRDSYGDGWNGGRIN